MITQQHRELNATLCLSWLTTHLSQQKTPFIFVFVMCVFSKGYLALTAYANMTNAWHFFNVIERIILIDSSKN
jgi:hypothetical protein